MPLQHSALITVFCWLLFLLVSWWIPPTQAAPGGCFHDDSPQSLTASATSTPQMSLFTLQNQTRLYLDGCNSMSIVLWCPTPATTAVNDVKVVVTNAKNVTLFVLCGSHAVTDASLRIEHSTLAATTESIIQTTRSFAQLSTVQIRAWFLFGSLSQFSLDVVNTSLSYKISNEEFDSFTQRSLIVVTNGFIRHSSLCWRQSFVGGLTGPMLTLGFDVSDVVVENVTIRFSEESRLNQTVMYTTSDNYGQTCFLVVNSVDVSNLTLVTDNADISCSQTVLPANYNLFMRLASTSRIQLSAIKFYVGSRSQVKVGVYRNIRIMFANTRGTVRSPLEYYAPAQRVDPQVIVLMSTCWIMLDSQVSGAFDFQNFFVSLSNKSHIQVRGTFEVTLIDVSATVTVQRDGVVELRDSDVWVDSKGMLAGGTLYRTGTVINQQGVFKGSLSVFGCRVVVGVHFGNIPSYPSSVDYSALVSRWESSYNSTNALNIVIARLVDVDRCVACVIQLRGTAVTIDTHGATMYQTTLASSAVTYAVMRGGVLFVSNATSLNGQSASISVEWCEFDWIADFAIVPRNRSKSLIVLLPPPPDSFLLVAAPVAFSYLVENTAVAIESTTCRVTWNTTRIAAPTAAGPVRVFVHQLGVGKITADIIMAMFNEWISEYNGFFKAVVEQEAHQVVAQQPVERNSSVSLRNVTLEGPADTQLNVSVGGFMLSRSTTNTALNFTSVTVIGCSTSPGCKSSLLFSVSITQQPVSIKSTTIHAECFNHSHALVGFGFPLSSLQFNTSSRNSRSLLRVVHSHFNTTRRSAALLQIGEEGSTNRVALGTGLGPAVMLHMDRNVFTGYQSILQRSAAASAPGVVLQLGCNLWCHVRLGQSTSTACKAASWGETGVLASQLQLVGVAVGAPSTSDETDLLCPDPITETKSITGSVPLAGATPTIKPLPNVVLRDTQSATAAIASGFVILVSASSPTALTLRRMSMITQRSGWCKDSAIDAHADDAMTADVGGFDSPTQLRFGAEFGAARRGSLTGNVALLCGFACLVGVMALLLSRGKAEAASLKVRVVQNMAWIRAPGVLWIPSSFLLPQLIQSSTLLIQLGVSEADVTGGILGAVFVAALVLLTGRVICQKSVHFPATAARQRALRPHLGMRLKEVVVAAVAWLTRPRWRWRPREVRKPKSSAVEERSSPVEQQQQQQLMSHERQRQRITGSAAVEVRQLWATPSASRLDVEARVTFPPYFVHRYGQLFEGYRIYCHWYLAVEIGFTIVITTLSSLIPTTVLQCNVTSWVLFAVCGVQLLLMVVIRPWCSPLDAVTAMFTSIVQTACAVVIAVQGSSTDVTDALATAVNVWTMMTYVCIVVIEINIARGSLSSRRESQDLDASHRQAQVLPRWIWALLECCRQQRESTDMDEYEREGGMEESLSIPASHLSDGDVRSDSDRDLLALHAAVKQTFLTPRPSNRPSRARRVVDFSGVPEALASQALQQRWLMQFQRAARPRSRVEVQAQLRDLVGIVCSMAHRERRALHHSSTPTD